jgi:hypothetical protein
MSATSPGRIFDLTLAPQISPRFPQVIRGIALVSAVGIAGLVTGIAIYNEITGVVRGVPDPEGLVIIGVAALFVGAFVLIYFGMGPGANRCLWDPDGFTLQYRRGSARSFRWDDPRLRFEMSEIRYKDKVEYDLTSRMPWHNDLTPELYEAILAEARRRGLDVRSRVAGTPAQRIITNRIQSKERALG